MKQSLKRLSPSTMKRKKINPVRLLPLVSAVLLPVSLLAGNKQKPNVIFILADDLGSADLGCYGNKIIRTPVIDGLASEGVRFSQAYAGASVSSPSRCALMTGLHTGHSRIRGNMCRTGGLRGDREGVGSVLRTNLQPRDSTIANILTNNGYATCLVNKWHLDGFDPAATPLDRGFQEFYGWLIAEPRSHNFYPTKRFRNREEYTITENLDGKQGDHNTDRSTREALDFIRRKKDEPFFLYLAYNAPHVPLDAKSLELYKDSGLPQPDQAYASMISHMDASIGLVLDELKKQGIDDRTIVIFASDNGGAAAANVRELKLNGDLRGWKGDLYEGGIRVPLIVRMPDRRNAGQTSDFPCYFPDMMPTLVALTGSVTGLASDGTNLVPEIDHPNCLISGQRYLYWEQFPREGISQAVRSGDWKLIRQNIGEPFELYNLKTDFAETTNLASRYPELVKKLAAYLDEAHVESENWPVIVQK